MSLLQRLKLKLTGYFYVGDRQRNGWKGPLPFYAFMCSTHGLVENYPHYHEQLLLCPKCIEERREKTRVKRIST